MKKPCLYIFTGSGISAESGIPTFRFDTEGGDPLWSKFDVDTVCNIYTFKQNYKQAHEFYDEVRCQLKDKRPNSAHIQIARLQEQFGCDRVKVLTTNVDDLHRIAGCIEVTHLHGIITEIVVDWNTPDSKVIHIGYDNVDHSLSDCIKPNVVFFYEPAPEYQKIFEILDESTEHDLMLVIGASLEVVPFHLYAQHFKGQTWNINPDVLMGLDHFDKSLALPATKGMDIVLYDIFELLNREV